MNVNGFLKSLVGSIIFFSISFSYSYASQNVDETCLDHGKTLDIMNDQVLQWKASTSSGFLARARIQGVVDQVFPDHTGHRHFSLKIGPMNSDHIEVIYNLKFGQLPTPKIGDIGEACGDYITSISQNGGYPPSPDGAIIHWVHRSPNGHDQGYVILNGSKY
ncbi:MAG: DUF3465 domain-containing protein [Pseudobdellovibrionaceae bacterium]